MKNPVIIIPALLLSLTLCNAQNITDVVRFGTENVQGSARFQALSGAFGALGGDMAAININPAGSAVFRSSKATISATDFMFKNTTSYFDNEKTVNDYNLDLNQIGGVFVFNNSNRNSKWKKLTLGINYDKTINFNDEFYASGASNISIDQYFLNFATGARLIDIQTLSGATLGESYLNIGSEFGFSYQQAFLGYWGGIIEPVDPFNTENIAYLSNGMYNTVDQEYLYISEGFTSKININLATQYTENFYFGASFNFHNLEYNNYREFTEAGYDPASSLQLVYFDNLMRTYGNALSFNVGGIAKIHKMFRVGLSYQSPVWWFKLTDELSQRIFSNIPDGDLSTIDFNLVNIFPDYKIQQPAKLTGSLAVVFGRDGVISFDYDYQDFSNAQLKPTSDPFFEIQNTLISTRLKAASSYRIGAEYRMLKKKRLSLRGGYRIQESPYENSVSLGDLQGYSFGLGYNFGGTQIDASFNQSTRERAHQLFDTFFPNATTVDAKNTNVTLSVSFKL